MALEGLLRRLRALGLGPLRDPRYDPEAVARRLAGAAGMSGHRSGHVHIHVLGFADHLLLFWRDGRLRMVGAKSPEMREGRLTHLSDSEFRGRSERAVLGELRSVLGAVEMHAPLPERTWPTYETFADWLASQPR